MAIQKVDLQKFKHKLKTTSKNQKRTKDWVFRQPSSYHFQIFTNKFFKFFKYF